MKIDERDALLIRIDERVRHLTQDDIPEIQDHLRLVNGNLDDHADKIITLESRDYYNTFTRKQIVALSSSIIGAVGIIMGVMLYFIR